MNKEHLISEIKNPFVCVHDIEHAKSDSAFDWHTHEEYEMYMCTNGKKIFCIGNDSYTLGKGDIIFINENVPHKTKTIADCTGFLIQFKPINSSNTVYNCLTHFINSSSPDVFVVRASDKINADFSLCLENIIKENTERKNSYKDFIKAEIYKIIALLYRYDVIKNPESFFTPNEIDKILPVLHYIDSHYSEKLSLDDLSSLLNFNKSHFCRIFKKCVNASPFDYINFVRISKAEKILVCDEQKTVSDISEETGFASSAYFIKIFKRYKSCTPAQYRKHRSII